MYPRVRARVKSGPLPPDPVLIERAKRVLMEIMESTSPLMPPQARVSAARAMLDATRKPTSGEVPVRPTEFDKFSDEELAAQAVVARAALGSSEQ